MRYMNKMLYPQIVNSVKYQIQSNIALKYGFLLSTDALGISIGYFFIIVFYSARLGNFKVDIPIMFLNYETPLTILGSALFVLGHYFFYRIFFKSDSSSSSSSSKYFFFTKSNINSERHNEEELKKRYEIKRIQKQKIKSMQTVMQTIASEKLQIEQQNNGLIIKYALFGKRSILQGIKNSHNPQAFIENHDLNGIFLKIYQ